MLLARGLSRLPAEILEGERDPRIANLLRTSWVYGVLANLCVSGLLLLIAPALGGRTAGPARRPCHRHLLPGGGVATFSFAPGRQHGLLVFSLLGAVLAAAVLLSK